ncbi:MAG: amino acid adenylation domain-containing protein [Muribaculaceae bacterium]|nr:amino acid adenylation domain-containing protein [Muribaculaceae bacterium]
MTTNIFDLLERAAGIWPNKTAIADDKQAMTFKEWHTAALIIGTMIATETESSIRKPVLVFTDRTIECLAGFMGVSASGNFYVPIDNKMPQERIQLICDTLNPIAAVTCTPKDKILAENLNLNIPLIDYSFATLHPEIAKADMLGKLRCQIIDLDPVYAIFTSGSTGVPKGVVVPHRGMLDLANWLVDTFNFSESDSLGNQTPFYFDGSVKDIAICLKAGATLNVIGRKYFSFPKLLIPFLNERRVTAILWATSAIMLIGNSKILETTLPQHLRLVTFAGEAMPAKQLNVWMDKLNGVTFANLYGPTEISVDCTYYIVDRQFNDDEYIPIGKNCRNKQVLLITEEGLEAKDGEPGEICVRGSGVALGYYNNFEKSSEVFVQNPLNPHYFDRIYKTGDIAKYNERGELMFLSRKDFQIKHKGNRIELGEIEVAINSIEGVTNAACIFDNVNDKIILYYTTDDGEARDIVNGIKEKLPAYMFPDETILLAEMPYSMNAKIDRIALKAKYEGK